MEILVPTASAGDVRRMKIRSLDTLDGKRLGIVSNGWRSMDAMSPHMAARLKERYGVRQVGFFTAPLNRPIIAAIVDQIAAQCDAAIVGLAN